MTSLFSNFDLKFWDMMMLIMMVMILNLFSFTYKSNFMKSFVNNIKLNLMLFFLSLKAQMFSKMFLSTIMSVMSMIFLLNFTSILSYNFSFTSQISVVMMMAMTMWIMIMMFYSYNNMSGFLSHCIPEGTPIYLTWFLMAIELISNMIRPITLTVRLVANILAGHLLMILLSKVVLSFSITIGLYYLLNLVEMVVSMIQAYIFVTMMTLYYTEMF